MSAKSSTDSQLIAEESKDQVCELEPKIQTRRAAPRIKIIKVDEEPSSSKTSTTKQPIKTPAAKKFDDDALSQRVQRFLSIVDIPPEEVTFAAQNYDKVIARHRAASETQKIIEDEDTLHSAGARGRKVSLFKGQQQKSGLSRPGAAAYKIGLSQEAKSRIIKEIIANYDQERFLDQFRSTSIAEVKLEKNKPEERKVRERVLKLMKSDVIRLNDVNYMRDLSDKLQETIKEKQEMKIQELAEREKKRERKLVLKGLLDDESKSRSSSSETRRIPESSSLRNVRSDDS